MALPERTTQAASKFNLDFVAIAIAMVLAGLIRLNILPQIKW